MILRPVPLAARKSIVAAQAPADAAPAHSFHVKAVPAERGTCLTSHDCKHGYRANVGVCVFNERGLVLAGRTSALPASFWQLPQGGIRDEETPLQAARRELQEETGISSVVRITDAPNYLCYTYKKPKKVSREEGKRYSGQCQKWILMRFLGSNAEINISRTKEFCAWRWMPLGAVCMQMPLLKHTVYVEMAVLFAPIICQATRTVDSVTKEPLLTPGSVTIFRHCIAQPPTARKHRRGARPFTSRPRPSRARRRSKKRRKQAVGEENIVLTWFKRHIIIMTTTLTC